MILLWNAFLLKLLIKDLVGRGPPIKSIHQTIPSLTFLLRKFLRTRCASLLECNIVFFGWERDIFPNDISSILHHFRTGLIRPGEDLSFLYCTEVRGSLLSSRRKLLAVSSRLRKLVIMIYYIVINPREKLFNRREQFMIKSLVSFFRERYFVIAFGSQTNLYANRCDHRKMIASIGIRLYESVA